MSAKGLIPLRLERGETYHVQGTEFSDCKITLRDNVTREFKVTFTNGAVLYVPLASPTVVYDEPEPGTYTAGPMTA